MGVRSEDHVRACVDHPVGLLDLIRPGPRVELDAPMHHDDDEVRGSRRVPDRLQCEREVMTRGRPGRIGTGDLLHRVDHFVDARRERIP